MSSYNVKSNPRIVVTFTTLPDRYHLLKKSIESIINPEFPLDAIYLTVPIRSKRLNKEYPPIPDDITSLCTVIRTDFDYGPIMKIYGALVSETDPETIIITCDDDVLYDKNLIKIITNHSINNQNIAICGTGALIGKGLKLFSMVNSVKEMRKWNGLTGFNIGDQGRNIDLIFGFAGVLYRRKFFPESNKLYDELFHYSMENRDVFANDDILLSGFLNKNNIKMKIFYDIPEMIYQEGGRADALSYKAIPMLLKLNNSVEYLKTKGFFHTSEDVSVDEPLGVRIGFVIFIVIIILILCYFFYIFMI